MDAFNSSSRQLVELVNTYFTNSQEDAETLTVLLAQLSEMQKTMDEAFKRRSVKLVHHEPAISIQPKGFVELPMGALIFNKPGETSYIPLMAPSLINYQQSFQSMAVLAQLPNIGNKHCQEMNNDHVSVDSSLLEDVMKLNNGVRVNDPPAVVQTSGWSQYEVATTLFSLFFLIDCAAM